MRVNGVQLRVRGKVQGVGFRPFVWQLAQQSARCGDVCNDGDGVLVRLLGDEVEVRAGIHTLGGFSAHADQQALLDWAAAFTRPPQQTFVVHGEPHAARALATLLHERLHFSVQVPQPGQVFEF